MAENVQPIKTCFISAPIGANLDVLREILASRDIQLWPSGITTATVWAGDTQERLERADLVICILPTDRQSKWVLFELGQAWALRKRILLIAPPKTEPIPFTLHRVVVIRAAVDNRTALEFAIQQLLSAPSESPSEPNALPKQDAGDVLGSHSDELLGRLSRWLPTSGESGLLAIVGEAIGHGSGEVVIESAEHDRGVDLVVWSDGLDSLMMNPLLVEIKRRIDKKFTARTALRELNRYMQASSARYALLLFAEGPPADAPLWRTFPPHVLVMSIRELIEQLRDKPFSKVIRDVRSAQVHGLRTGW